MKKIWSCMLLFIACLALAGCGGKPAASSAASVTYHYKDQSVTLASRPQKIVPLSAPLLNMLYAVDGTAAGRPTTDSPIPKAARSLPEIGHVQNINMETLVGLQPDLVLGEKAQNGKLASMLDSSHIPYLMINYDGISDNVPLLKFLGQISGTETQADKAVKSYEEGVQKAKEEAAAFTPARIAVLRATGKSVTAETPQSITASMCEELKMNNVITSHSEMKLTDKTVPYSLEQLAADDPDIIFVVTMGRSDEINKTMDEEMRNNPAWSNLKAVRNSRVYFLPPSLYLMNPGLKTPEAMEGLIQRAYHSQS